MKPYNWGIIGAGRIANKFAEGLKLLPNAKRYATASGSMEKAEEFRDKHGFEKAYGSYQGMLDDRSVDIVYIATTNNLHYEHTMMSLEAGKAVLCEKPFASNLQQVKEMITKARENNLFLMEALWTRLLPSMIQLKTEMEEGTIGQPFLLQCDFGFISPFDPFHRIYNPQLGGGSVPDIGIYPISTAMYLFGKPTEIKVMSVPAPTGTDWTTAILFKHAGKEISMLTSSFETELDNEARIYGEKGKLILHKRFHTPTKLSFICNSGNEHTISVNTTGNGYNYEAAEVMDCLDKGLLQSPAINWQFSIDLMEVLDEVAKKAEEDY